MKKKVLKTEHIPEFNASIEKMPEDSRIFVDKSLEIANYVFHVMEHKGMKQKDLADKLGKSEAEVSKWLTGMHNYTLRSIAKIEAALDHEIIHVPTSRSFESKLDMNVSRLQLIDRNTEFKKTIVADHKQVEKKIA